MEQYIGEKKVEMVVVAVNKKTPGGEDMVEVSFTDGTKEIMPKRRLETVAVTAEKGTPLQDKRQLNDMMANTILALMAEYGVKVGEVDSILDAVTNRVTTLFDTTYEIKFGSAKSDTGIIELVKIEVDNFIKEDGNKTI